MINYTINGGPTAPFLYSYLFLLATRFAIVFTIKFTIKFANGLAFPSTLSVAILVLGEKPIQLSMQCNVSSCLID